MALYRGFSSFTFSGNRSFSITDIELVKTDLLNHIFTRKGERVMMADFGTSIPDLVFEPLDDITSELIESELEAVFDFDPRVETVELVVEPSYDTNTVHVSAKLLYIELQMVADFELNIQFERG